MADNVNITAGTGTIIATDEVTINAVVVQVPRGKVGFGADGAYVDCSSTNPLPVTGTAVVSGTVAVSTTGFIANAGTNLNTSLLALEAGGNLASVNTKTPALGQALVAGSVPVVLPLTQITSLTPPAAITGFALDATLTGGTQKTKLVDSAGTNVATVSAAGAVKVDGSAATQPVSIAATVAVSDAAGSLTVDAPVATPVFVRLSDGTTAISTLPVSIASLPSGPVTNAGVFAVQVSSALPAGTAVIGHVIADSGSTTAVTGNVTIVQATGTNLHAVLDSGTITSITNALPTGTNTIGFVNAVQAGDSLEIAGTLYTVRQAFANATASGDTTVVAAVVGKKIRVLAFGIGPVSSAVNCYFNNATTGAICSTKFFVAGGGMARGLNQFGHFTTGTNNEALRINLSGTANVGVDILYIEV